MFQHDTAANLLAKALTARVFVHADNIVAFTPQAEADSVIASQIRAGFRGSDKVIADRAYSVLGKDTSLIVAPAASSCLTAASTASRTAGLRPAPKYSLGRPMVSP